MKYLRRPTPEQLAFALQYYQQLDAAFTYDDVGASNVDYPANMPAGFVIDHTEASLGNGQAVFQTACENLRTWQQTQLGWVTSAWPEAPFVAGAVLGSLARSCGIWWLNACRIVYTIDEQPDAGPQRFGFAYGTVADHVECGEERFLLEWNPETDVVRYEILAFSRPAHWTTRIGYPLVRRVQKRFARDSVARMQQLCRTP